MRDPARTHRFTKKMPASALDPAYKLSLPYDLVEHHLKHLVQHSIQLASSSAPPTHQAWEAMIVPRRNKARVEYTLKGWKLFAQAHEISMGDHLSFEFTGPTRLVVQNLTGGAGTPGADKSEGGAVSKAAAHEPPEELDQAPSPKRAKVASGHLSHLAGLVRPTAVKAAPCSSSTTGLQPGAGKGSLGDRTQQAMAQLSTVRKDPLHLAPPQRSTVQHSTAQQSAAPPLGPAHEAKQPCRSTSGISSTLPAAHPEPDAAADGPDGARLLMSLANRTGPHPAAQLRSEREQGGSLLQQQPQPSAFASSRPGPSPFAGKPSGSSSAFHAAVGGMASPEHPGPLHLGMHPSGPSRHSLTASHRLFATGGAFASLGGSGIDGLQDLGKPLPMAAPLQASLPGSEDLVEQFSATVHSLHHANMSYRLRAERAERCEADLRGTIDRVRLDLRWALMAASALQQSCQQTAVQSDSTQLVRAIHSALYRMEHQT